MERFFKFLILFSVVVYSGFCIELVEPSLRLKFQIYSILFFIAILLVLYFQTKFFQKKIQESILQLRKLASAVSRNSLFLVGSNIKIVNKNQKVLKEFETAMGALASIKEISELNSEHAKNTCAVGQESVLTAKKGQSSIESVISQVSFLSQDSEKIGQITDVINDIAFKTNLLALNASVEAARVGEHGKGFSVVAQAVKQLSEQSSEATSKISGIVQSIVEKTVSSKNLVSECGVYMSNILSAVGQAAAMNNDIASGTKNESEQIRNISFSLKEIEMQTKDNLDLTNNSASVANKLSKEATQFEAVIGQLASFTGGISVESPQVKKALLIARKLAEDTSRVFENELSKGSFTENDLFSFSYLEIKNDEIGKLSHLFDVSRVPSAGFLPKKYFTKYDLFVDKKLQGIFDKVVSDNKEFIFALPVDLNAYGFTHNSKYCKAWRGTFELDLVENRIKRFFSDNLTFLRSSRVGLDQVVDELPLKFESYSQIEKIVGSRNLSTRKRNDYLVQSYYRDTGELATNLSVPLFIKKRRFGSIVVCWT